MGLWGSHYIIKASERGILFIYYNFQQMVEDSAAVHKKKMIFFKACFFISIYYAGSISVGYLI